MTPEISTRAQYVAIALSSLWLAGIVYLVIRESLTLRSSLGWIVIGLVAVGVSIYPEALFALARITGIGLPANALFLFGFIAVLILLFGHTLVITKLLNSVRALAQRIALHELDGHRSGEGGKPRRDPVEGEIDRSVGDAPTTGVDPRGPR